jgi:glycosyltransferase involved in cell wall biosynthesis
VSVLIPCANSAAYLPATLESVLGQTWRHLEVIVVDDGSVDRSPKIVESIDDPRVRLIRQTRTGVCRARNTALRCSSGDYIQYLDADDLLSADKIEVQLRRLEGRSDALASGQWGRFHEDVASARFEPDPTWGDLEPLDWIAHAWQHGVPMHCVHMWLIPRQVAMDAGPWNEKLIQNTDGEYFTRVILRSNRILFSPGARAYYRSGLTASVSAASGSAQRESRFLALHLCENRILAREDSERMRRGLSLAWQTLAHASYPFDIDFAEHALARAHALSDARISPNGGLAFKIIAGVLGWRQARKLQALRSGT